MTANKYSQQSGCSCHVTRPGPPKVQPKSTCCECDPVYFRDSKCVVVAGEGTRANPFQVSLDVACDPRNITECSNNGVFTPDITIVQNDNCSVTIANNSGDSATVLTSQAVSTMEFDGLNGVYMYTDETGQETMLDVCQVVADFCNVELKTNIDGNLVFTDNAGKTVVIDVPAGSTMTDNNNGTYNHTDGNGMVTTIDVAQGGLANATVSTNAANGVVTVTDNLNNTVDIDVCSAIEACPDTAVDISAPTAAPIGNEPTLIFVDADGDNEVESGHFWDGTRWVTLFSEVCQMTWCVVDGNGTVWNALAKIRNGTIVGTTTYVNLSGQVGTPAQPLVPCP